MRYGSLLLCCFGLLLFVGCGNCNTGVPQVIDDGGVEPPLPRQIFLTGCVEDIETTRSGATVAIVDTNLSTTTDLAGNFTLDVTDLPPGSTIQVRAVFGVLSGFTTVQLPAAGNVRTTITLPECILIEEPLVELQVLEGCVLAPDESTPIAGAKVVLEDEGLGFPETFTEGDGSYSFDLTGLPLPAGNVTFVATKSSFSGSITTNVGAIAPVNGVRDIGCIELTPPAMAVVTGIFDRMQDILAKTGFGQTDANGQLILGTEQFDIYDGDDGVTLGASAGSYPDADALFFDLDEDGEPDLNNYDIIFVNCGVEQEIVDGFVTIQNEPSALDEERIAAIRDYVANGGILYCTDLAYDFVEQAFPEFIDFYGSDGTAAGNQETPGAAERGFGRNPGETPEVFTNAAVLDGLLSDFLDAATCDGAVGCRNGDGSVFITGFAPAWAAMNGAHPAADVKIWVEGEVEVDEVTSVRPLTASFGFGDGTVHFSSYHTEEANPSAQFRAQERILQFLVFESIVSGIAQE